MAGPRTWLAIPALAIACAALAFALHHSIETALAFGALAAAVAAAVRAFAGPTIAAAIAASVAALLASLALVDLAAGLSTLHLLRAACAGAAAAFAIAELARPLPVDASPWPAIGAALVAGVLDPSYVALLAIAGVRYVLGPWTRPRWSIAVPIVGVLAIVLALAAALTHGGAFAELWELWTARAGATPPLDLLTHAGDTLGPIATIAALCGLGVCVQHLRYAAIATLVTMASALAVDLSRGALGGGAFVIAAIAAGVGLARLAATVRWPTGQTFVGATAGFLIVVAPAMLRW